MAAIPDRLPVWVIHVGAVVAGFGMGTAYSAHAQLALRSVPEVEVGSTTASLQLTDNLGVALGTGAVGAIVAFGDEIGWPVGDAVAVALIVPACVAVVGVWLSGRLPRAAAPVLATSRRRGLTTGGGHTACARRGSDERRCIHSELSRRPCFSAYSSNTPIGSNPK